jgi:Mrp family chromosome partitioning ATPase
MGNPAAQVFSEIREGYDYVIVDAAPFMLMIDTFLINK